MAKRRFELRDSKSQKFWEVGVSSTSCTVTYGRIGTAGQTKVKDHGSSAAARTAADKLIESKTKKGYVEVGKAKGGTAKKAAARKPSTKRTPRPSSAPSAGPEPAFAVKGPLGIILGVWAAGNDVWIAGLDGAPKRLGEESFSELMDSDGFVERWRFDSPRDAAAAVKHLAQEKHKEGTLPDYFEADFGRWKKLLKSKALPRIARYAVGRSGPVVLERHAMPRWVHPRPPSHCSCGRVMRPVYEMRGPIDPRLGKQAHVYVSFCPGGVSSTYCETSIEVLVQRPDDQQPAVLYFNTKRGGYHVVARSVHWDAIGDGAAHVVTEHFGDKGEVGVYRSRHFRDEAAAKAFEKECGERARYHQPANASAFGKWYVDTLQRIHDHHAVKAEKRGAFKLAQTIAPMAASGSLYALTGALYGTLDRIGGQPNFTQSDTHTPFSCVRCKAPALFLFQVGAGAPWWSDMLNDGDAGSFQFFACGECQSPFGRAVFECH